MSWNYALVAFWDLQPLSQSGLSVHPLQHLRGACAFKGAPSRLHVITSVKKIAVMKQHKGLEKPAERKGVECQN